MQSCVSVGQGHYTIKQIPLSYSEVSTVGAVIRHHGD